MGSRVLGFWHLRIPTEIVNRAMALPVDDVGTYTLLYQRSRGQIAPAYAPEKQLGILPAVQTVGSPPAETRSWLSICTEGPPECHFIRMSGSGSYVKLRTVPGGQGSHVSSVTTYHMYHHAVQ